MITTLIRGHCVMFGIAVYIFGFLFILLVIVACCELKIWRWTRRDIRGFNCSVKRLGSSNGENVWSKVKAEKKCIADGRDWKDTDKFIKQHLGAQKKDEWFIKNHPKHVTTVSTCRTPKKPCLTDTMSTRTGCVAPEQDLFLNRLYDLYGYDVHIGISPAKCELETFWQLVLRKKIALSVLLDNIEENKDMFQWFPTSIKSKISFSEYRVILNTRIIRPFVKFYEFAICRKSDETELFKHRLIYFHKVWPMNCNPDMVQGKIMRVVSFAHVCRERNIKDFGYAKVGMLVLDRDGTKGQSFFAVFLCRQVVLQYGKCDVIGVFQYIQKRIFGAFTFDAASGLAQVATALIVISNYASKFMDEQVPKWPLCRKDVHDEVAWQSLFVKDPETLNPQERRHMGLKPSTEEETKSKIKARSTLSAHPRIRARAKKFVLKEQSF